jgi:hypothetical protein
MNRHRTTKTAAALATTLIAAAVLSGCGGDSAYCTAVKDNQRALNSFGTATTDAAFAKEARAVRRIAATDPEKIGRDWTSIDTAMRGVLKAQKKAGITFDGLNDPEKRAEADDADVEAIQKAYGRFNDTAKQRKAVVEDVKKTCDVTLK